MHPALIVLIVIALIVLLIALLLHSRIRVRVIYNEKTFSAYAYWLFLRFNLNSDDEDSSLLSEELLGNGLFQDETDKAVKKEGKPVFVTWKIERITRILGRLFNRLPDVLTLKTRRVVVTVGTDDAAKTAMLYGAVSTGLAALLEVIDRNIATVKTKNRDVVDVRADFVGGKTTFDINILLVLHLFTYLKFRFLNTI
ncbi:MAG: DUF2953 domain-containing protein [Clostridia bacterium]|nr:DUF2953 domain-containing protein [Clostridia bacterium]